MVLIALSLAVLIQVDPPQPAPGRLAWDVEVVAEPPAIETPLDPVTHCDDAANRRAGEDAFDCAFRLARPSSRAVQPSPPPAPPQRCTPYERPTADGGVERGVRCSVEGEF